MTAIVRAAPTPGLPLPPAAPRLILDVFTNRDSCVVHVSGELDLSTRDRLESVAAGGHHPSMMIDLSGVTFMDCSGYGALVASRLAVELDGRALAIIGQTGQPARLCTLIADLERDELEPTGAIVAPPVLRLVE